MCPVRNDDDPDSYLEIGHDDTCDNSENTIGIAIYRPSTGYYSGNEQRCANVLSRAS